MIAEERKEKSQSRGSQQNKEVLNWKKYLYNENLLTDALKFKHWDQTNLDIPEKQTLIKDLTRTRNDDPYFKREKTQLNLKLLATFYCQQNNVNYQQGMLEVIYYNSYLIKLVVPFLLLRKDDFSLSKCYAYFNCFMNKYFPKVLQQKVVDKNKELVHALSAIQFSEILIKYHCAEIYSKLFQLDEFNISMVVTQWIMTLFSKQSLFDILYSQYRGTKIELVHLIFDRYMQRNNPNYIFYLTSALFSLKENEINQVIIDDIDMLLPYLNKNLKNFQTELDIQQWFQIADKHYEKTPKSYESIIKQSSFHEQAALSMEDVKELINVKESVYSKFIFIFGYELFGKGNLNIDLRILDCRLDRKIKLNDYLKKDIIIKSKVDNFKDKNTMTKFCQEINSKYQKSIHLCLCGESNQNLQMCLTLAELLFNSGRNYISILVGGINEIKKYRKNEDKKNDCAIM